jgi:hypothetical protein
MPEQSPAAPANSEGQQTTPGVEGQGRLPQVRNSEGQVKAVPRSVEGQSVQPRHPSRPR